MLGIKLLRLRSGIDDPISTVEPATGCPVRAATLFPIEEHERSLELVSLVEGPPTDEAAERIGGSFTSHMPATRAAASAWRERTKSSTQCAKPASETGCLAHA